nr:hypothetical protein [uncultured Brevundimonas sp.]
MSENLPAIDAQAELHHQYLLGLQLMVAVREGPDVIGEWMFRLFRRQHEEKFLSSFEKLGAQRPAGRRRMRALSCAFEQHGRGPGRVHGGIGQEGLGPLPLSQVDV